MKSKNRILFFLGVLILLFSNYSYAQIQIQDLTCEHLTNPLAIDVLEPRLSWQLTGDERGIEQTAYQVVVASTREKLNHNEGDLWNSGKVESDQSINVVYDGVELKSKMDCFWKVKVWTNKGESSWSESANWSIGLLFYNEWWGRWIGFDRPFPWDDDSFHSRLSARYLRKEFEVKKPIKQAKVYLMGLGLYELYFNGQKIGDQVLAPVPTDYDENVKYNVFDVTDQLKSGDNAVGIILGNGRYYTMRQHYKPYKIKNFGFPKLMFHMEIEYEDGTKAYVLSNNSWKGTADGPILSNNEYDGEEYDARKEMPGWNKVGFDDKDWLEPEYVQVPNGTFEAQMTPNMKVMESIKPVSVTMIGEDRYILDLGQNIAGWMKMTVQGDAGDTVQLRFAEVLQDNGELFTANLRDAKATDIYILKGGEKETWEPRFVYHGFQFVEITGYPGVPTVDDFVGQVVYDEMETTGTFETSNPIINQVFKNSYWGIRGNYKGMPVDCPQRNERQPWLGDRSTGCYGESFIFGNEMLYSKWLDDIGYSQKENGAISDVVPNFWRYYSDNMTWPGTYLMVADMLHRQYADVRPIKEHYQSIKKWMDYMKDRYMNEDYIVTQDRYGDWCVPPVTIEAGRGKSADKKHPRELISTAYYYYYLGLMEKFALLSGKGSDVAEFRDLAQHIKEGFNRKFYLTEKAGYGENILTDNLLALQMGLVPEENHEAVFSTIVDIILNRNNGHLSTGLIGAQWLMRALTENGRADIAYQLATNTTYPSWGYMIENGATAIWELWNGNTAAPHMNSYNHVMMLGDLIIWDYEHLAGIKSSTEDSGFKEIVMKPEFVEGLNFVNASYQSVYGEISSEWQKDRSTIEWKLTVPANTKAKVYIPAKSATDITESGVELFQANGVNYLYQEGARALLEVGSGEYYFQFKR